MKLKNIVLQVIFGISGFNLNSHPLTPYPTSVTFKTSDTVLQNLFDRAEEKAKWNVKDFGQYKVLVEGGGYNGVFLETQPMGGLMYAKRNIITAKNNIQIFMDFQREDGRIPGVIYFDNNSFSPYYSFFQGNYLPMAAFEIYYWLGKDRPYLEQVYNSLKKFDEYLWRTRDSDHDGCLEAWTPWDVGEDGCERFRDFPLIWPFDYPPTNELVKKMSQEDLDRYCGTRKVKDLVVPAESMDMMSYSYSNREVLSQISKELQNGQEKYWKEAAREVAGKLKKCLWDPVKGACFDKDKFNKTMNILLHNNLSCMYFESFDQKMADRFIQDHLLNPDEFWTPMPLPSVAINDPYFKNDSTNNWNGQSEALTFQRTIRALENYGHYAELTLLGNKFLEGVSASSKFTQQFDPFTAKMIHSFPDGYGPSLLTSLEFISRFFGIHLSCDQVYWSCLDRDNDYTYTQEWGGRQFKLTTKGDQVYCFLNDKELFSFSKGVRVVSDLDGKIIEVVGIDTEVRKIMIDYAGKSFSFSVNPNSVYSFKKRFYKTKSVGFWKPENL